MQRRALINPACPETHYVYDFAGAEDYQFLKQLVDAARIARIQLGEKYVIDKQRAETEHDIFQRCRQEQIQEFRKKPWWHRWFHVEPAPVPEPDFSAVEETLVFMSTTIHEIEGLLERTKDKTQFVATLDEWPIEILKLTVVEKEQ